jgi:glucosamine-6-phosphate deaminase
MKVSFSTLGCPSWSLPEILDAAGRLGYDGVELRFVADDDALWARPELTGAGLRETLGRLRDAALAISCVDTRSFFHDPPGPVRDRAHEEALRSLELAARLGASGIRVFGDRVQTGQDLDSTAALVAEGLQRLGEAARPLGVEVWLESHGDFARARDTLGILERVRSPSVAALWDPANAFEAGETPAEGQGVLGARIRHVHVKDIQRPPAGVAGGTPWTPALPGRGVFGPERVLSVLEEAGYDRWISFEWEKKWHPAIEDPSVALPHFIRWASAALRHTQTSGEAPPLPSGPRAFVRGRLAVSVHGDRVAMGRAAAALVGARLRETVERAGSGAAIFASAPSQNEFLAALRADPDIPWRRITAFHLDEYVGVSPQHPASFRRFLSERLFDHVPVQAFHGLDGECRDADAECARYASLLRQEGPALAILGVGENGHLAFIDPPECDFTDPRDVRVVTLDEACRRQQVHDGGFARLEDVPPTGLSLTIPFLMRVPEVVAIVPGPAKRAAIHAALDGPLTRACPASILRRHPGSTLFLDEASAAAVAV